MTYRRTRIYTGLVTPAASASSPMFQYVRYRPVSPASLNHGETMSKLRLAPRRQNLESGAFKADLGGAGSVSGL